MNSIAVSIQGVSKKFRLFNSPKERLWETLHPLKKKYHREFWALKDISFEVAKGTTVGIIGRNGSGKSTLLQIICSVLKPTTGSVAVNGRISTLLELGADFNPEFTGSQNVLLKGITMGFSQNEMKERLPMIEAFADIGEFIDQPVKTYSSGMFVRLAFATAINVDPDILVVDEVLAVGDAKFQHKCYSKFIEFQEKGKTIILVTHDTNAIVRHCDYAILLENGIILQAGEPKDVVNYYYELIFMGDVSSHEIHKELETTHLVEEGYMGFNIVQYMKNYYAISQDLGHIDLTGGDKQNFKKYQEQRKCFVGNSYDEVKHLVDQLLANHNSLLDTIKPEQSELEKFLEEVPAMDNCIYRNSYNKNEYRYGSRQAEIIDYLIVAEKEYDPTTIVSGDEIDIYVKIKYFQKIEDPMIGFAIKSIDGIDVYGLNTKSMKIELESIDDPSTVAIFKWSVQLNLAKGDYFIDIGCAEYVDGESLPLDRRYDIAHLAVHSDDFHAGFVKLETRFERVC